jgi:hypothetical protein
MSLYYPQAALRLQIRWEDFGKSNPVLEKIYFLDVLARNLIVEINDYTEADTFQAEIDYSSFPFDPRTIRSCGVTIHMEDMRHLIKNGKTDPIQIKNSNLVFQGFADEENITFDDSERRVRLEGRDFTSLFLDSRYLNGPIPLSKPLNKILEEIIKMQESTKKISLDNRVSGSLPTLAELAPDFNETTGVRNPRRNESYWDVIQDLVSRAGLVTYIEKDKLVLDRPRNLYKREKSKVFMYGFNIKNLEFSRKLGRMRNFNIKVVSLDVEKKELIEAKIPLEAKDPAIAGPENTITQLDKDGKPVDPPKVADYLTFRINEIASKDHLISVGEEIYQELSRQEIEGKLVTFDMEVPETIRDRLDRTKPVKFSEFRTGTPIQVVFDTDDLKALRSNASKAEKRKFLITRGYEPKVAEAFSESLNRITTPLYTKAVRLMLSQEEGFKMELDFINFIEVDNAGLR